LFQVPVYARKIRKRKQFTQALMASPEAKETARPKSLAQDRTSPRTTRGRISEEKD
jgi:hypothetical protein